MTVTCLASIPDFIVILAVAVTHISHWPCVYMPLISCMAAVDLIDVQRRQHLIRDDYTVSSTRSCRLARECSAPTGNWGILVLGEVTDTTNRLPESSECFLIQPRLRRNSIDQVHATCHDKNDLTTNNQLRSSNPQQQSKQSN